MTARILDGKRVAEQIRGEVRERVQALQERGVVPGLAAVHVGEDPASRIYLEAKHKACADVGIRSEQFDLPAYASEDEVLATIRRLNRDPEIHGILVQLPLPKHVSELAVQETIDPQKDVDGLHPLNVGLMVRGEPRFPPATPYGIVELLLRSGIQLEGAEVVVVGYGELVGAPLSIMLAQDSIRGNATVTICHVKTRDLAAHTRRADILVAAAGVPGLITAEMVRPGATVVDVGVHRTEHGLVGDVRFDEVKEVAGAITPVPGGVGPMTVAMLLVNTVRAAEAAAFGR
ncbi:MAG TPA: bifunctional methylenetetrahydrofolate dehydrogenase/methenyltetrahydrofolate cyclohydrolase FolD [Actinomycetota bacterium]|nr:bifunctional methylenetetrahydrofolate dehydrogenase/methenyltetrahydrofolate cyclohydrolase FolD [Actinomycetota bacterium]